LEEVIKVQTTEVRNLSEEVMRLSTQNVEMEVRVATITNDNQRLGEVVQALNRKAEGSGIKIFFLQTERRIKTYLKY
jgi:hypothetical protein